jgi:hypothetical protein
MPYLRRDFFKNVFAVGVLPGIAVSPSLAGMIARLLDQDSAQGGLALDSDAYNFWAGFLDSDAEPITAAGTQSRGKGGGSNADEETQPVFLHYGAEGFRNAAELDPSKLVPEGDVMVSMSTSTIKLRSDDQAIFRNLQNAQIRVDVAQKAAILPILEASVYTVVAGMRSLESRASAASKGGTPPKKQNSTVQDISISSDAAWQKMQNIPLPGGMGRWALNLEAQKKDSLFGKVLQVLVKEVGLFVPVIGLPGIAVSALESFNRLYGALHAQPVSIMKGNPLPVFATQEAIQKTGAPGAAKGIQLQNGTYILIPAKQSPPSDQLKSFTVTQGRVVPPNTPIEELDTVAADTLKDVSYVTFDVGVTPSTFVTNAAPKKA